MIASIVAHWLFQPLHGLGYQFWSGIGSDVSELTLVLGLAAYLRHHNCHVRHCPRLQWKPTAAGDQVCRRHHPDRAKTAAQVRDDHHQARANE